MQPSHAIAAAVAQEKHQRGCPARLSDRAQGRMDADVAKRPSCGRSRVPQCTCNHRNPRKKSNSRAFVDRCADGMLYEKPAGAECGELWIHPPI